MEDLSSTEEDDLELVERAPQYCHTEWPNRFATLSVNSFNKCWMYDIFLNCWMPNFHKHQNGSNYPDNSFDQPKWMECVGECSLFTMGSMISWWFRFRICILYIGWRWDFTPVDTHMREVESWAESGSWTQELLAKFALAWFFKP